ncbi:hypothetical protein Poli38472_003216 [Pythium oligandrum]|uniref:Uncharacterized protein n=1 Tax=Pythium oligandrum TaxID=41045 RepID=A0A8K1C649_PYTOL|nr:hypothetical protein Poli38472_003214 [Pythium oligandrum]TMW57291.1 hypothetical protein Poli38472_003216 [Pythium oligandrum]|eukprot:TMW57289.1 hypothetical protein Poli38472_003214 [Pythium oligandrum]
MSDQQKPVDTNQVVLDKKMPSGGTAKAAAATAAWKMSKFSCIFTVLAVLFVVGNVIALYVLHFVNRPSITARFSFSNFLATTGTVAQVGDVVSLSTSSKVRNGAGTTAYLDRFALKDSPNDGSSNALFYEYLNFAPMGTTKSWYTTNLVSYRRILSHDATNGKKGDSILTTATYSPDTKSFTIDTSYDLAKTDNRIPSQAIRGIATLSDTQAVVLSIDDGASPYKTNVMPVSIKDGKVSIVSSNVKLVASGSVTNLIARLSATTFAIAYYEPWVDGAQYGQRIEVGTVKDDGTLTLTGASVLFGPMNDDASAKKFTVTFGTPQLIKGEKTASTMVIPYYGVSTKDTTLNTGLCVTMGSYVSTGTISAFTTGICNTKYQPTSFPESVMVSDNLLAIVFYDSKNNNALTIALVYVTATSANFRGEYVLTEALGSFVYGSAYGFSPKPSLALLSGNRLAVSFLNAAMDGKQCVKVFKISTSANNIKSVTPVMPVAAQDFTLVVDPTDDLQNNAITQELIAVSDDGVAMGYVGKRPTPQARFTVMEAFGAPVGIIRSYDGKNEVSVAISGKTTEVSTPKSEELVEGQFYYATTAGYVVPSLSDNLGEYFKYDDMLVATDGKIGVAIDDDKLFVSTAL